MWPLFLDRDGVINRRIVDDYVRNPDQFEFLPGALGALSILADWAPRIVVITNQQGVGRGLMTHASVDEVHGHMMDQISASGGRIDEVLVCPHLVAKRCPCRKPAPGLASDWLAGHPDVDPRLSIMVGDAASDIAMGTALARRTGGCDTVRIGSFDPQADYSAPSLEAFATSIRR